MPDTKPWWQSKIIWTNLVAALFALLAIFHLIPTGLDQAQIVEGVMAGVTIATAVFRLGSHRPIG